IRPAPTTPDSSRNHGDTVKVKVLEVDVARKRIALTRRMDDEPGHATSRPGGERGGERDARRDGGRPGGAQQRDNRGGAPRPQQAAPFNSAMADALKGLRRS
ncbi:MAG: S1 RNA-binding domain-containing protein, partial [Pseudoxanthomonas sp.]|nr:S1 RNA-binding domain-containing protein [Pseudoxanthomonas sp.]